MTLNNLSSSILPQRPTEIMPALFVGHGSPMNAIQENEFTDGWKSQAQLIPPPSAILCISAHWETRGTQISTTDFPETIHDFGGFPCELYQVQYPAPGSRLLAAETEKMISGNAVTFNENRGLDHGCWSILKHLYPLANIPVVQLSINYLMSPAQHFCFAKELSGLRQRGVLIVGSGNIVHNLHTLDWNREKEGFDWAISADSIVKEQIVKENYSALTNYTALGKEVARAIPTPEHFLPLLYVLGAKGEKESITFFNEKQLLGSLSMTSIRIG